MNYSWCIFLLIALVVLAPAAFAQDSRLESQERLNDLREQIEVFEQQLSETAASEQASLERLENASRQVTIREELLGSYQQRLEQLEAERDSIRNSMAGIENQVDELREEYRRHATHAYMFGRLHDLALILSARSINQMLIRVQYLHRFTEQREGKLNELQNAVAAMEARREKLAESQRETEQLIAGTRQERQDLLQLKQSRTTMIQTLRAQQAQLQEEIQEKRSAANELERRIRRAVAAAASRRASDARNDAAFAALSGSFRDNRGGLPWPSPGVVTEPFGKITHPVYGTTTMNPGILISTTPSAEVRAVFRGEVLSINVMPEYGTYVLMQHGQYQTLYGNLSLVYVEEGDALLAGETIGRAGTPSAPKGAGVFFATFDEGRQMNPADWLRER